MTCKEEYTELLKSGDLLEMFPQLNGTWRKDKEVFTKLCEENRESLKDIDINYDEL